MWNSAPVELHELTESEVAQAMRALFDQPQREFHHVAVVTATLVTERAWKHACSKRAPRGVAVALSPAFLVTLKESIQTKSWWDTVDSLAKPVGYMVRLLKECDDEMDAWSRDEDFWVRRIALIHQVRGHV